MSLRAWPPDFPVDIAVQRQVPHESRADSVMYRQVLASAASDRGWAVHLFDAKDVEADAARILGPPWSKDHRIALAATIVVS
jgi:hypothetical protein